MINLTLNFLLKTTKTEKVTDPKRNERVNLLIRSECQLIFFLLFPSSSANYSDLHK